MAVMWTERREPSDAEREAVAGLVERGVLSVGDACSDAYLDRFSLATLVDPTRRRAKSRSRRWP